MKTFQVLLTRSYIVNIDAKNEDEAKYYSEFFIGGERDLSNNKDSDKFKINEIEMTVNDAFESIEVNN
jgi:hypothetical protein